MDIFLAAGEDYAMTVVVAAISRIFATKPSGHRGAQKHSLK
jgi:hypothetical protein